MAPRTARAKKEERSEKAATESVQEVEKKGRKRQIEEIVPGTENAEINKVSAGKGGKKSKKTELKSSEPKSSTENGHKEMKKQLITNGKGRKGVSKPAINPNVEITERDLKSQSVVNDDPNVEELVKKSRGKGKKVAQQKMDEPKSNGVTDEKTESNKTNSLTEIPKSKGRQKKKIVEKTTNETSLDILQQRDLKPDSKIKDKIEKSAIRGRAKKVVEEKGSAENNLIGESRRRTFIIETNKNDNNVQNNSEQANPKPKIKQQKSAVNKTNKTIKEKYDDNTISENIDLEKEADNDIIAVKDKMKSTKSDKKITTSKTIKKQAVSDSQNDTEPSTSKAEDNSASKTTTSKKRWTAKTSEEVPTKKPKPEKPLKNKAVTDYESIDFSNLSKDSKGNSWNIKICSWNVDGIRAWVTKGGLDYIKYEKPDILCLQEVKCAQDKLPAEATSVPGYHAYWLCSDKDGYAGVGIYTTKLAINVQYGLEDEELDAEGRIITAEYEQFYLISTYVPNAGRGLVTLDKKLRWNEAFRRHVNRLDRTKPVIICGDMNVAHQEIDLKNPKTNKKNAGFTPEERAGMTALLSDGYTDTFRQLYPDRTDAYTFWTYMMGARAKNIGWRLDYVIVSDRLAPAVCDNVIRSDVYGSDHCPIALCLHLTGSPKIPSQETP